jgi:hypothetical protein
LPKIYNYHEKKKNSNKIFRFFRMNGSIHPGGDTAARAALSPIILYISLLSKASAEIPPFPPI